MMFAVGILVRIEKTIGVWGQVISRSTFDYFGYERPVGDRPGVRKLVFV